MKKLLFTFLAALCCTVMAFANGIKINNIYYILDDKTLTATVTYEGKSGGEPQESPEYKGSITIPSTVSYNGKDYEVKSIGYEAFRCCNLLISVTIPEGVTSIGKNAFHSCFSMTSVIIPSSVTSIDEWAFAACQSLTLMFQGDKPKDLHRDIFLYNWFINIMEEPLPNIVVCDKYEENFTNFFDDEAYKIVPLSKFKAQVLIETLQAKENAEALTEQDFATIESCLSAIESATTPGDVFTNKEIVLLTIKLSPSKQDAIATLKDFVKNKVGLDICCYITAINNATSEDQITEILNNATEEINNSKTFTVGDKTYYLNNIGPDYTFYGDITFNDKDPYQSDYDFTVTGTGSITYNRTFTNKNWQALYVPFAISCSDWGDDFDVAAINNFHEYTDDMGQTYKTELEIRMVTSGTLKPNHPYLIKAHDAPEPLKIELTTKEISKSDNKSYSCSSMESQYTFTGTYQEMNKLKTNDYIFMSGGKLCKAEDDEVVLLPQRWYLKIKSLGSQVDGGNTSYAKAKEFDIKLLDDEATGIEEITVTRTPLKNRSEAIYNLNGMRVNDSYKGIVIKNGKKVYQR